MTRQSLTQAGNSSVDTGKRIDFLILVAVLLLLSLSTCAEPNDPQEDDNGPTIPSIDDSSNISIITWNIEHFPQAGSVTIARVQLLLDSLDADIYCLQEIDNPVSLTSIIDKLEKYEVVHSPGDSYVRSTVYKPDVVHLVSSSEFLNTYGYEFAWRPPFISEFEFEKDGRKQSLNVINVHLKAFGDRESMERRHDATRLMHNYLSSSVAAGDSNFVIAGDWNDDMHDPDSSGAYSFEAFLNDPQNFYFVTDSLAATRSTRNASYPGYPSMIDNILISRSLFDEFDPLGVRVLRLDEKFSDYSTVLSDHRPVLWSFKPN